MTTATVTAPTSRPTTATPRPRVRHGILAAALAVVALLRAGQGDWWWAGVLAAGAAAELAVLLLARRRTPAADETAVRPGPRPDVATLRLSLEGHRRATRTWTVLTGLALVAAAALLVGDPALAAVVAVVGVVALVLRRRSRRTCARIERLLGAAGNGAP
jgi:hypothetical protein